MNIYHEKGSERQCGCAKSRTIPLSESLLLFQLRAFGEFVCVCSSGFHAVFSR